MYNDELKIIIHELKITYKRAAELSGYSHDSIRAYLLPPGCKARRNLSLRTFEAIKTKLLG